MSTAQGQKITRQRFLISFYSRGNIISSQTPCWQARDFSDNQCADRTVFWCSGLEISPLLCLHFSLGASHMSWVKQKKILNCLLFLSAGTRKGSGERQMSLSPWIERQTAYKALAAFASTCVCLLPLSALGRLLGNIKWQSLKLQLGDKHSQESDWMVKN